jgi:hypothetical protein
MAGTKRSPPPTPISLNANFLDAACGRAAWSHVRAEHAAAAARAAAGPDAASASLPPTLDPVDGTTLAVCDGIGLAGFVDVCARAAGRAAEACERATAAVAAAGDLQQSARINLARAALTATTAAVIVEDALASREELGPDASAALGGVEGEARLAAAVARAHAAVAAARRVLGVLEGLSLPSSTQHVSPV